MALQRIEQAVGPINGVNDQFFTKTPYLAGSVRVFLNGQLLRKDCLTEITPSTGEIRFDYVPPARVGDVLQLAWIDAASVASEITGLVQVLFGKLEPETTLTAVLFEDTPLSGSIDAEGALTGCVVAEAPLSGSLEPENALSGFLRVCEG